MCFSCFGGIVDSVLDSCFGDRSIDSIDSLYKIIRYE